MADRGFRGTPTRTERADRLINEGHSRGLDIALANTEAKIRNMNTERIYAFDKNGKEISHSTNGSISGTALPKGKKYKDAILTHNHPGGGLGNTIAGRIGRTIGGQDLATTIGLNAAEMRAVTKNYTYSIKRPKNGWGISSLSDILKVKNEVARKHNGAFNREYSRVMEKLGRGEVTREYVQQALDRADVAGINKALKSISKKYGWSYTRKKTS